MRIQHGVLVLVIVIAVPLAASREQSGAQVQDLKMLSLSEDIRRYGVDTLADALRLADSVSVSRFNGGSRAITTRGFSAVTNNKLLVMIDGRTIYTQLFGGVFWEAQHVPLPDLDRIEIIRGPAGTLWGPNAVNGVINIITKKAADTQGGLVRGVTGSRERGHLVARYGGQDTRDAADFLRARGPHHSPDPRLRSGGNHRDARVGSHAGHAPCRQYYRAYRHGACQQATGQRRSVHLVLKVTLRATSRWKYRSWALFPANSA